MSVVSDAALVGVTGCVAGRGGGVAGLGGRAAVRVLVGASTVIGSSRLSSNFGCMLMPTAPTMPPMISAPSRIVNGSRMSSRFPTCDDPPVRPT